MSIMKLETVPCRIAITFGHGENDMKRGQIFLEPCSPFHGGPESVDEFLNTRREKFFPFLEDETQVIFQINRSQILILHENIINESTALGPPAIVKTIHGRIFRTTMLSDLPSAHARLQDYLNQEKQFLRFFNGAEILNINRNLILQVTEHE